MTQKAEGNTGAERGSVPRLGERTSDEPEIHPVRNLMHSRAARIGCGSFITLALVFLGVGALWTLNSAVAYYRGQEALEEAYRLSDAGNFSAAVPLFTAALNTSLNDRQRSLAYGNRGWALTKVDRDGDALRDFTAALEIDSSLTFAVLDRGLAFHRLGKFDEALADYRRTIELNPNEVDAYRNRALILAHRGDIKGAIADMNEAIRCAPGDPRWLVRRAQFHLRDGDLESALASFEAALRMNVEIVDAQVGRARILILRGEGRRALADLKDAISLRPNSAMLVFARGVVHAERGELEQAIDDCAEAYRLKKDFASAYAIRAMAEFRLGALEAALAFSRLAWELDPKMPLPHQVRGRVLDLRSEYAEAIDEFDRAIAGDSEYVLPVVWRAMTQSHAGDHPTALRELEAAVEKFPGEPESHLMLAWFLATCPAAEFRDGTRAKAEAQFAVDRLRRDPYALDVLATAYAEAGEFVRAAELEIEALDKTPARSGDCARMEMRLQSFIRHMPYRED